MERGRYEITLSETPAQIVEIAQKGVPMGLVSCRTEPGYMLVDGTALLESEKDECGFYVGGAGMDGIYLRTPQRYEPVRDDAGKITAFRCMSRHLTVFSAEEQKLIFQYGMNTKEHLMQDLAAALRKLNSSPQVYALFESTAKKLEKIPDSDCVRLMADIRAAYKGRNKQSIRERQAAASKTSYRKRSVER